MDNNNDHKNLLLNIRELCDEINNLTKKLEDSPEKSEIKNEIVKYKYKILKMAKKPPKPTVHQVPAGTPSENIQTNSSIINWRNSLRNPYFF